MKRLAQQQVRLLTKIRHANERVTEANADLTVLTNEYRVLEQKEEALRGRLAGVPDAADVEIPPVAGPVELVGGSSYVDRDSLLLERRQLVTKNAALGAHPAQVEIRTKRIKEIDAALEALDTPPTTG
jgi:hypothetical protein